MRKIMLASVIVLVAGCGGKTGPVTATPELESKQRENEARVRESESEWQKRPTTGDQEQEAKQRGEEDRVNEAESAMQKQQQAANR